MIIRNDLLIPFVKETGLAGLSKPPGGGPGKDPLGKGATSAASAAASGSGKSVVAEPGVAELPTELQLCPGIRNAYSILLRIAQLEQQLFDSLFKPTDEQRSDNKVGNLRQLMSEQ